MKHLKYLLAATGTAWCLTSCQTVPETGRHQLVMVSASQEAELGASAFNEQKRTKKISSNTAAKSQVQRVGRRIAKVAPIPHAQWEFVVFEDSTPNAFALPGGKIGVNTGILALTQNDAGMAAVLGHEIAHVTARHGGERMSQSLLVSLGGAALDAGLAVGTNASTSQRGVIQSAYGAGSQIGVLLPYSRAHESEADRIGLLYMARAGYNPEAAVSFWKRMADYARKHGGAQLPSILRTHPVDEARIKNLEKYMPAALEAYRKTTGAG